MGILLPDRGSVTWRGHAVDDADRPRFGYVPEERGLTANAFVHSAPHETWIRVLSLLPAFAPMLLPARIALGAVAWWEVLLVISIMLVAINGRDRFHRARLRRRARSQRRQAHLAHGIETSRRRYRIGDVEVRIGSTICMER